MTAELLPLMADSTNASTRRGRALLSLREMLLKGAFPPGKRLEEVDLSRRLVVSRPILPSLLDRLSFEGLLEPGLVSAVLFPHQPQNLLPLLRWPGAVGGSSRVPESTAMPLIDREISRAAALTAPKAAGNSRQMGCLVGRAPASSMALALRRVVAVALAMFKSLPDFIGDGCP